MVAHNDYYLCPLSAKQMPEAELDRLLERVWSGAQSLVAVRRPRAVDPTSAEQADEADDPVAVGFEDTVEQRAQDQSG